MSSLSPVVSTNRVSRAASQAAARSTRASRASARASPATTRSASRSPSPGRSPSPSRSSARVSGRSPTRASSRSSVASSRAGSRTASTRSSSRSPSPSRTASTRSSSRSPSRAASTRSSSRSPSPSRTASTRSSSRSPSRAASTRSSSRSPSRAASTRSSSRSPSPSRATGTSRALQPRPVMPRSAPAAGVLGSVPGFAAVPLAASVALASSAAGLSTSPVADAPAGVGVSAEQLGSVEQAVQGLDHEVLKVVWLKADDGAEVDVEGAKLRLKPTHVLVLNNKGDKFLIELDVQGQTVMFSPQNAQIMDMDFDAVLTNNSRTVGLEECARKNNICALAFVCEGDMCYRRVSAEGEAPFQAMLRQSGVRGVKTVSVGGGRPLAVVKFSELTANPVQVLAMVEKTNQEVGNDLLQQCLADWKRLKDIRDDMNQALNGLEQLTLNRVGQLGEDVKLLRMWRDQYAAAEANSPLAMPDRKKYELTVMNLIDRKERYQQIIDSCFNLRSNAAVLQAQMQDFRDTAAALAEVSQPLGKVVGAGQFHQDNPSL